MAKHNKRKHRDFAYRSISDGEFGTTQTRGQVKRPRLSGGDSSSTSTGSPETLSALADGDGPGESPHGEGDWHTVTSRKKQKTQPQGRLSTYPEIVFHKNQQTPIRIQDLQNLALYTLADGLGPTWLAFKNSRQTQKVVILMVPGLEMEMFDGTAAYARSESYANGHPPDESRDGQGEAALAGVASFTRREPQADDRWLDLQAWKSGPAPKASSSSTVCFRTLDAHNLPSSLAPIASMFTHVWRVKSPGDAKYSKVHSPLQAMLVSPLPASAENKSIKGVRPPAEERQFRPMRTPVTAFIHSAEELRNADYPVHPAAFDSAADGQLEAERREKTNQSVSAGWVDTKVTSSTPILPNPLPLPSDLSCGLKIYSLDCEMVLTSDNIHSLARISLISYSGLTILDKYVKPSLPITNYFTQFSGITPSHLESVTTTLEDIQSTLLSLLNPSTILLGHSLESDLAALKITHPFIIDTALIYPHPRGMPLRSSLKFLTAKYLRRDIQSSAAGHDSVEDARAVLDLVKLKCEKGPKWGTTEAQGEPLFRRLSRVIRTDGAPRASAMVDYGTPERGYGKEADFKIGCANDDEVVEGVIRAVNGDPDGAEIKAGGVDFVWGRLRGLEFARGWSKEPLTEIEPLTSPAQCCDNKPSTNTNSNSIRTPTPTASYLPELTTTISHIHHIHSALPPCTLLVVYSGTGDPRPLVKLQKQQTQYRKEFKVKKWDELSVKWTDEEEQALHAAAEKARSGVGFVCIK